MTERPAFPVFPIGRMREQAVIGNALRRVMDGQPGGVILVSGEAGIGKTYVLSVALDLPGLRVLRGPSRETGAAEPFAPLAELLRAHLAAAPGAFDHLTLRSHLALLLPELGPVKPDGAPTLFQQALRSAVETLLVPGPLALVFEDLQWADHATLALLPALAEWLAAVPALLIGTFRRDELPRSHPLRRVRLELRRSGAPSELTLEPLTLPETAALAQARLGARLAPVLARLLFERSEGVPLFVEELTRALYAGGRLRPGADQQLELVPGTEIEVPLTLRDAVDLSLDRFSAPARAAAETAAVLGLSFGAEVLLDLTGDGAAFDELTEGGLLNEERSQAAFRHALIREAIYAGIPWARRRRLHREVAARLEALAAPPGLTAEHWLAGHEPEHARAALLALMDASCRLHAYHDAAQAAGRALDLWPAGLEEARRLAVLDRLGRCAQACGLLAEAARAWREAAQAHREAGDGPAHAEAQRRLAGTLELQGLWEQALEAHRCAAAAFAQAGLDAAAAEERLAVGAWLRSSGQASAALEVLSLALGGARLAGRRDLEARILGQQGNAQVRLGQIQAGLQTVRAGLTLALAGDFGAAAVEILHRVADALEHAGDYAGARGAYTEAINLCEPSLSAAAYACRACLAVPLYHNGVWDRAAAECRGVLASASASAASRAVAGALLGTVLAQWGRPQRARPALLESLAQARQLGLVPVQLRALWGLALADEAAGDPAAALSWTGTLHDLWAGVEDHYHILFPLRWASRLYAAQGDLQGLRRAADTLSRAADLGGGPVAFSALAHTLGELAWLEGQPEGAARQFGVALELLRDADTPFEVASTHLRAGQVAAVLGQRAAATRHLELAQHAARRLGAAVLARQAAAALGELGEPAGGSALALLTRRQLEVLRLVALGRTDRAIAQDLHLSPRTVEMHVGRLLASLDSRTRAEAVGKAAELGLLALGPQ